MLSTLILTRNRIRLDKSFTCAENISNFVKHYIDLVPIKYILDDKKKKQKNDTQENGYKTATY